MAEIILQIVALVMQLDSVTVIIMSLLSFFSIASIASFLGQWYRRRVIKQQLSHLISSVQRSDSGQDFLLMNVKKARNEIPELAQACYMVIGQAGQTTTGFALQEGDQTRQALEVAAHIVYARVDSGQLFLRVIAQISQLLGLFGTIWGLLRVVQGATFLANSFDMSVLSAGVAQALLTTVAGLLVAIPATFFSMVLSAQTAQCQTLCEKVLWHLQARVTVN